MGDSNATATVRSSGQVRDGVVWLAAGFALSPIIVDLGVHFIAEPWTRYALIFVPLSAVAIARESRPPTTSVDGYAWLAASVANVLVAVVSVAPRFGRLAIPLAVIGLSRTFGFASLRTAAMTFWIIPVPAVLSGLVAGLLNPLYLGLASTIVAPIGIEASLDGSSAQMEAATLLLHRDDSGLPVAALLSGLGWYAGIRSRESLLPRIARAVRWGALAIPIQAFAIVVAMTLTGLGHVTAALACLGWGLWIPTVFGGWVAIRRCRARLSGRGQLMP